MLDREHLGLMDIEARRNAFGRQVRSFEADLDFDGLEGPPLRAVFIRAPWIAAHGDGVEILASVDGHPSPRARATCSPSRFTPSSGATRACTSASSRCAAVSERGA